MFDSYIVFCPDLFKPIMVNGKLQIGARIGVGEEEEFLPLDIYVAPKQWDLIGCKSSDKTINEKLLGIKDVFRSAHAELFRYGLPFSAKDVVREMLNHKNVIPVDKMVAEIYDVVFADRRDKEAGVQKKLTKKQRIAAEVKNKMDKRKFDLLTKP